MFALGKIIACFRAGTRRRRQEVVKTAAHQAVSRTGGPPTRRPHRTAGPPTRRPHRTAWTGTGWSMKFFSMCWHAMPSCESTDRRSVIWRILMADQYRVSQYISHFRFFNRQAHLRPKVPIQAKFCASF